MLYRHGAVSSCSKSQARGTIQPHGPRENTTRQGDTCLCTFAGIWIAQIVLVSTMYSVQDQTSDSRAVRVHQVKQYA